MKYIRANPELIRKAIQDKNEKADLDKILEIDENRRRLQYDFDTLKAHQNSVSQVIATKKRAREDASPELAEMAEVAASIKTATAELNKANEELDRLLLTIPNIPEPSVPVGKDESLNEVISHWGSPVSFDFTPVDHLDLANHNGYLDMMRGAKISGSGFPIYTGEGARLERALINFMLEY
ncbi:MAG TPA: serine--tRNA ligase, partial [Candidatus Cloacimonadota bacterium]|nr:serine--tRNA ligase [Candidatus Cloacimonadota bacterium]